MHPRDNEAKKPSKNIGLHKYIYKHDNKKYAFQDLNDAAM